MKTVSCDERPPDGRASNAPCASAPFNVRRGNYKVIRALPCSADDFIRRTVLRSLAIPAFLHASAILTLLPFSRFSGLGIRGGRRPAAAEEPATRGLVGDFGLSRRVPKCAQWRRQQQQLPQLLQQRPPIPPNTTTTAATTAPDYACYNCLLRPLTLLPLLPPC